MELLELLALLACLVLSSANSSAGSEQCLPCESICTSAPTSTGPHSCTPANPCGTPAYPCGRCVSTSITFPKEVVWCPASKARKKDLEITFSPKGTREIIINNFGLPGRNVGNNYLNKASFVLSLSGGLWRKHSRSRIVLSEFNHTALT